MMYMSSANTSLAAVQNDERCTLASHTSVSEKQPNAGPAAASLLHSPNATCDYQRVTWEMAVLDSHRSCSVSCWSWHIAAGAGHCHRHKRQCCRRHSSGLLGTHACPQHDATTFGPSLQHRIAHGPCAGVHQRCKQVACITAYAHFGISQQPGEPENTHCICPCPAHVI
jgi:hypothetical protein